MEKNGCIPRLISIIVRLVFLAMLGNTPSLAFDHCPRQGVPPRVSNFRLELKFLCHMSSRVTNQCKWYLFI
eukprot:c40863_g1_i1 orf=73-285(+)